jgi:DNA-directed RNA polymerase specialized sigma24 family protein
VVTADRITRARAGDGNAFRELTEPYRRELQVHCYRMLGSFQDAEDALQDTLLAAWQGLDGFEGRASIRTWLYRIATQPALILRSPKSPHVGDAHAQRHRPDTSQGADDRLPNRGPATGGRRRPKRAAARQRRPGNA